MAASDRLPPSVRLLRRLRRGLLRGWRRGRDAGRRRWVGGFVVGVVALWLWHSLYTVSHDESAAVLRFGRLVDDNVEPGLHARLPFGIDRLTLFRTGEVQRLPIEGETAPALDLLTGDENLVEGRLVAQFRVHRPGAFLYTCEDPKELVRQAVRAALTQVISRAGVEELLTSAKVALQNEVRRRAQARLDSYAIGVTLVAISLASLDPPGEAGAAFRDVTDARSEAAERVAQAEGQRERLLRLARGEASQKLAAAEAAAHATVERARGRVERFQKLLATDRRAAELLRSELRNESARRVLGKARLITLAPGQRDTIDFELLETGGASETPVAVAVPKPTPSAVGDGEH